MEGGFICFGTFRGIIMKRKTKRFLFYFFYIAFVMVLTTTSVLAIPGRCYITDKNGAIKFQNCRSCKCEMKHRRSDGQYCHECRHHLTGVDYKITATPAAA